MADLKNILLGQDTKTMRPYSVVIIDDSSTIRLVLKQILVSEGFEIILEAEDGVEALSKIKAMQIKPDLILLDYEMPKMSGVDFLKDFNSMGINSKIIVISSTSDKATLREFLNFGINSYILKPIERKVLVQHIARIIGRKDYLTQVID